MSSEVKRFVVDMQGRGEECVLASDYAAIEAECERLRVKLMAIASAEPARHDIEWAKAIAAEGNGEPYAKWREAIEERDALAAELARWERSYREVHEPALQEAHAYIQELRAELEAIKGQQPVGHVYTMQPCFPGEPMRAHAQLNVALPAGTKLYAEPQPSPDVRALVEALEVSVDYLDSNTLNSIASGSTCHRKMRNALAAHRQGNPQ